MASADTGSDVESEASATSNDKAQAEENEIVQGQRDDQSAPDNPIDPTARAEPEALESAPERDGQWPADHPKEPASEPQPARTEAEEQGPVQDPEVTQQSNNLASRRPITDGRIKDPVPNSLQGKTDSRSGDFAVQQPEPLSARSASAPQPKQVKAAAREAAARRSSQLTVAAAEAALGNGYQAPKRSERAHHPPEPGWQGSPHLQQYRQHKVSHYTEEPAQSHSQQSRSPRPPHIAKQTHPVHYQPPLLPVQPPVPAAPNPVWVKAEQARLLTLLRSLHPVVVVDQLCKAVAYFGGVPEAPPPPHDAFPLSVVTNEPGSALISWLSELYPPHGTPARPSGLAAPTDFSPPGSAYNPGVDFPQGAFGRNDVMREGIQGRHVADPSPPALNPPTTKPRKSTGRPRGRPKGSKSSKPRKDKGVKKSRIGGAAAPPHSTAPPATAADGDANAPFRVEDDEQVSDREAVQMLADHGPTANAQESFDSTKSTDNVDTPKKRGRPKGSKNKPRHPFEHNNGHSTTAAQPTASQSPKAGRDAAPQSRGVPVASAPTQGRPPQQIQSRKRSLAQQQPQTDGGPPTIIAQNPATSPSNKRRRVSKESQPQQAGSVLGNHDNRNNSQSSAAGASASLQSQSPVAITQAASVTPMTASFDSQSTTSSGSSMRRAVSNSQPPRSQSQTSPYQKQRSPLLNRSPPGPQISAQNMAAALARQRQHQQQQRQHQHQYQHQQQTSQYGQGQQQQWPGGSQFSQAGITFGRQGRPMATSQQAALFTHQNAARTQPGFAMRGNPSQQQQQQQRPNGGNMAAAANMAYANDVNAAAAAAAFGYGNFPSRQQQ